MRIALVAPRYGAEVNGGAETLARLFAEQLARFGDDVTVLTTCALDYRTWSDHFPPGRTVEAGVTVLRFPVPVPRDSATFDVLSANLLGGAGAGNREAEEAWMDAQGPNSPGLLEHLATRGTSYDAVLFVPYLYATTVRGLPLVAERSVLVSAMHDEPPLRLSIFDDLIAKASTIVFNTPEEAELGRRRFGVDGARCAVIGVGVDPPPASDPARFRSATGITSPFALCLGRVDPSKGSKELIAAHEAYRRRRPRGLDLVFIGRAVMEMPERPWLHAVGFVDEELKHDALAAAAVLVVPSPYESLSLVLLEAWSHGLPTVSAARSPVLVGQSRRSGAGLWYAAPDEYAAALDLLETLRPLARTLGWSGRRFTRRLSWASIIPELRRMLSLAAEGAA